MKEIRENLNLIKEEASKLENDNITLKLIDVINMLTDKVEELLVNQEAIEENIKFIDTDISGIQEELFEEVSFEDLEEIEDEYEEIKCKHCEKPIFVEKDVAQTNEKIKCPYCGENILR